MQAGGGFQPFHPDRDFVGFREFQVGVEAQSERAPVDHDVGRVPRRQLRGRHGRLYAVNGHDHGPVRSLADERSVDRRAKLGVADGPAVPPAGHVRIFVFQLEAEKAEQLVVERLRAREIADAEHQMIDADDAGHDILVP